MSHAYDVLAAVLEHTGLRGKVYCRTAAHAPWGLSFGPQPGAVFHTVSVGACWISHAGERLQLSAGDLLLFARAAPHAISDAPRSPKLALEQWLARPNGGALGSKTGALTEVMCGVYEFDPLAPSHPVLELLPERVHLRPDARRPDLAGTLASLHGEYARGPMGSTLVISRLLDILFVQIVRAWAEAHPRDAGWIGALGEPMLARALAALHRDPGHAWSIEELAHVSGMSRATLARRFSERVGQPPLAYLTRVRLDEAARRLTAGQGELAEIAQHVGYTSEFAFNRAFRRHYGEPPGAYRERVRRTARPE